VSVVHEAGSPAITLPGLPADIDHHRVITQMVRRACSPGFDAWWRRAESVGFCVNPIQLIGTDDYGGERIVWMRCNNRRATVCPSCSDLYAATLGNSSPQEPLEAATTSPRPWARRPRYSPR